MTLELDGRKYSEDDLVHVATRHPHVPYVFIALDGSAVFVARRDGATLRFHHADRVGVDALAAVMDWPWLPAALG
jgi:hypothetical protein